MPVFRVIGDTKIPVSKHLGALWKERLKQCQRIREERGLTSQWRKALELYTSVGKLPELLLDDVSSCTQYENVVLSTITAQIASVLTGQPACAVSGNGGGDPAVEVVLKTLERVINALISEPAPGGVALSGKLRRAFVVALCTNNAFMSVDYIAKEDSSEAAVQDLIALSKQLESASSKEEIAAIEGQLLALEQQVSLLSPSGLKVRVLLPGSVVVDPANEDEDLSGARWVMVAEYIPTKLLQAIYYEKHGDEYKSIFAPTVTVFDDDIADGWGTGDCGDYGFGSREEFERQSLTKVWHVWDKATRRVYMFNDKEWSWPIWVYDDPYQLPGFFNIVRLSTIVSATGKETFGEVTYYTPQQESINLVNEQVAKARSDIAYKLFFPNNRGISEDDVMEMLNATGNRVLGIDVPEGMTTDDLLFQLTPNVIRHPELFSTASLFDSINRIAGIPSVLRGEQFKTNTTNEAISAYSSVAQLHSDFKTSSVEDFIGSLCDLILFLVVTRYSREEVALLIGAEAAATFPKMSAEDAKMLGLRVKTVGGSTTRPTSKARQQQALDMATVLGQFGRGAPGILLVVLKVLARAFEGAIVKQEDWAEAITILQQQLTATPPIGSPPGPGVNDNA